MQSRARRSACVALRCDVETLRRVVVHGDLLSQHLSQHELLGVRVNASAASIFKSAIPYASAEAARYLPICFRNYCVSQGLIQVCAGMEKKTGLRLSHAAYNGRLLVKDS